MQLQRCCRYVFEGNTTWACVFSKQYLFVYKPTSVQEIVKFRRSCTRPRTKWMAAFPFLSNLQKKTVLLRILDLYRRISFPSQILRAKKSKQKLTCNIWIWKFGEGHHIRLVEMNHLTPQTLKYAWACVTPYVICRITANFWYQKMNTRVLVCATCSSEGSMS